MNTSEAGHGMPADRQVDLGYGRRVGGLGFVDSNTMAASVIDPPNHIRGTR